MFCSNCGKKLDDDSNFCFNCGQKAFRPQPAQVISSTVPANTATQAAGGVQPEINHNDKPAAIDTAAAANSDSAQETKASAFEAPQTISTQPEIISPQTEPNHDIEPAVITAANAANSDSAQETKASAFEAPQTASAQPDFVHPYNPVENPQPEINDLPPIRNMQAPSTANFPDPVQQTFVAPPTIPAPKPYDEAAENGFTAPPIIPAPQPDFVHPYNPAENPQPAASELPPIRNMQAQNVIPVQMPEQQPKNTVKTALIITLLIALALGICFGIVRVFFWDSTLRLVMGEKGYNKYMEQKSLTMLLPENEDTAAALNSALQMSSGTLGNIAQLYSAAASSSENAWGDSVIGSASNAGGANQALNTMLPYLLRSLGADNPTSRLSENGVEIAFSPTITLGSYSEAALGSELVNQYSDAARQLVELINSISARYSFAYDGDNIFIGAEFTAADEILANAEVYQISDKLYLAFPYFTSKSFVIDVETKSITEVSDEFNTLDSKEVEKLLNELIEIYTDYISGLEQQNEAADYNIKGVTAKGTAIVTELTGRDVKNVFAAMYAAFDSNEYFTNYILNYMNTYVYSGDEEFTAEKYHSQNKAVIDGISEPSYADDFVVLRTKTIVDGRGEICGKIFELVDYDGSNAGDTISTFSVLGSGGRKVYAVEDASSEFGMYLSVKEATKGTGTALLTIRDNSGTYEIRLDYNNIKQEKLGSLDIWSGSLSVSLGEDNTVLNDALTDDIRAGVTSALSQLGIENADIDKLLYGVSVYAENKVSGDTMETVCSLNLSEFGSIGGKMTITLGCDKAVAAPSGASLDINNMSDEEKTALLDELSEYYKQLASSNPKIKNLLSSFGITEEQISDIFSAPSRYNDKAKLTEAKSGCKTRLMTALDDLTDAYYSQGTPNDSRESFNKLTDEYSELIGNIMGFDGTYDEFFEQGLTQETDRIVSEMNRLAYDIRSRPTEDTTIRILCQYEASKSIIEKYLSNHFNDNSSYYTVEYVCIPEEEEFIAEAAKGYVYGDSDYDIIIADSDMTKGFAEQYDMLYTLNELGVQIDESDYYAGALNQARSYNGELVGLCYQFCPTVTMYRTDYAEQYLGVTSPQEMQSMLDNMPNSITAVGEKLTAASNGKVKMFAGYSDIADIYSAQKSSPWVDITAMSNTDTSAFYSADVDCLKKILTTIKLLSDSGSLDANVTRWDGAWSEGFDEGVMFYTAPDWFLFSVLGKYGNYGAENADKWACCEGWGSYVWGGDYILVPKTCNSQKYVASIITDMFNDDSFLQEMSTTDQHFSAKISVAEKIGASLNTPPAGGDRFFDSNVYNTLLSAAKRADNRNSSYSADLTFADTLSEAVKAMAGGLSADTAMREYFGISAE